MNVLAVALTVLTGILLPMLSAQEKAATSPGLTWADIHWEPIKIGNRVVERAALLLPVRLDGKEAKILVQLDLGADLSQFDRVPYEQLFGKGAAPHDRPKKMPFTGTFGGARVTNQLFDVLPEGGERSSGDEPVFLGTLGADFFQNRILLLDFVRQRVCIMDERVRLPEAFEKNAAFVPLTVRDGNLFVPISINGKEERGFFYDTGSSLLPILTTRAKWQEITGRTGSEPDNEVWRAPSWGKEAVMVGAGVKGEICVGKACLQHPVAFFESSGLKNLQSANLFGNSLFFDRFVVIVDIPEHRFGLLEKRADQ